MIGIGSLLTYWVQEAWHLYLIFGVLTGLAGRATLFSPLMVNIQRWFEERRGMAVGVVGGGQAIAGATWPVVFQAGIESIGWRGTAFLYGLFVLLTMVPLSLVFLRPYPACGAEAGSKPEYHASPRAPGAARRASCPARVTVHRNCRVLRRHVAPAGPPSVACERHRVFPRAWGAPALGDADLCGLRAACSGSAGLVHGWGRSVHCWFFPASRR